MAEYGRLRWPSAFWFQDFIKGHLHLGCKILDTQKKGKVKDETEKEKRNQKADGHPSLP